MHVVGSCYAKFETGQTFEPTTLNISFIPWSPKRSATILNAFAQLFSYQHYWGHTCALNVVSLNIIHVCNNTYIHHIPKWLRLYCLRSDPEEALYICAYIKESTYSSNIQSYSQYRKNLDLLEQRVESVGNRSPSKVMMTFPLFAPARTKWLGWRKDRKSRRDRSGRFCDIYCAVILRYSFALRSDILWSSCFESYGPKDTR